MMPRHRYLQRRGHRRLPYKAYLRARELGVEFPEATPTFSAFHVYFIHGPLVFMESARRVISISIRSRIGAIAATDRHLSRYRQTSTSCHHAPSLYGRSALRATRPSKPLEHVPALAAARDIPGEEEGKVHPVEDQKARCDGRTTAQRRYHGPKDHKLPTAQWRGKVESGVWINFVPAPRRQAVQAVPAETIDRPNTLRVMRLKIGNQRSFPRNGSGHTDEDHEAEQCGLPNWPSV